MAGEVSSRIQLEKAKLEVLKFGELEELQTEHPTFIEEVVQTFAEEAEVMLRELAEHCARGTTHSPPEFQPARDVLHKLKGSALTLGAAGVGDCCTAVRNLLVAGSLAELHSSAETPGSLAALRHSVESVKGVLFEYLRIHNLLLSLEW